MHFSILLRDILVFVRYCIVGLEFGIKKISVILSWKPLG